MSVYTKFLIALGGMLGVAVSTSADGEFSLNDGCSIAAAGVAALLVYALPNNPPR